jgi:hypothetical protein
VFLIFFQQTEFARIQNHYISCLCWYRFWKLAFLYVLKLQKTILAKIDKNGIMKTEIISNYPIVGKKDIFKRIKDMIFLSEIGKFIYPLQSVDYKYRSYEKLELDYSK